MFTTRVCGKVCIDRHGHGPMTAGRECRNAKMPTTPERFNTYVQAIKALTCSGPVLALPFQAVKGAVRLSAKADAAEHHLDNALAQAVHYSQHTTAKTDQLCKLLGTAHLAHAATQDVERCLTDIDRAQKRLDDLVKECSNNLLFDSSSDSDWRSRLQQMANRSYTILCAAMDIDIKPLEDATAAVQAAILRLPAADELHWQVCGDAEGYAKPGAANQVVEELMKEHPSNVYVSGQPGMGKSRLTKYIQVCIT